MRKLRNLVLGVCVMGLSALTGACATEAPTDEASSEASALTLATPTTMAPTTCGSLSVYFDGACRSVTWFQSTFAATGRTVSAAYGPADANSAKSLPIVMIAYISASNELSVQVYADSTVRLPSGYPANAAGYRNVAYAQTWSDTDSNGWPQVGHDVYVRNATAPYAWSSDYSLVTTYRGSSGTETCEFPANYCRTTIASGSTDACVSQGISAGEVHLDMCLTGDVILPAAAIAIGTILVAGGAVFLAGSVATGPGAVPLAAAGMAFLAVGGGAVGYGAGILMNKAMSGSRNPACVSRAAAVQNEVTSKCLEDHLAETVPLVVEDPQAPGGGGSGGGSGSMSEPNGSSSSDTCVMVATVTAEDGTCTTYSCSGTVGSDGTCQNWQSNCDSPVACSE